MTLARLYRRYLSTGALPRESTVVIDEISLLTHRDFETCVLPLARLGAQLILLGDPASQLLAISDIGPNGEELAQDIPESVMLKSAVGFKRLRLTHCRRSDKALFDWYVSLGPGGSRYELPLGNILAEARLRFPARGVADHHLCLSHNTLSLIHI